MSDEKKKKEKKKGSGIGKVFLIGIILGMLGGVFIGWMTEAPSFIKAKVDEAKASTARAAKGAADKVRGGTADALEGSADAVRPKDEE